MAKQVKWFFHPIFVFVFSVLALASSLVLYIYWYVRISSGLQVLAHHYHLDPGQFLEARTWVVVLVLSILVGIILAGTLIIFIYNQKMVRLNRLQHEFINNFTHELKTPVTSLKLYLETLLKHPLPREEQCKYYGYMLQDAERLSDNISRILNLAKIGPRFTGVKLEWTADSQSVIAPKWAAPEGFEPELWRIPVNGGSPQRMELNPALVAGGFSIHPDGRRVAYTSGLVKQEVWAIDNFLPMLQVKH